MSLARRLGHTLADRLVPVRAGAPRSALAPVPGPAPVPAAAPVPDPLRTEPLRTEPLRTEPPPTAPPPPAAASRAPEDVETVSVVVRAAAAWAWRLVAIGVAVYFIAIGLAFFADAVIIPLLIALLVTALLQPLVEVIARTRLPRIVATLMAMAALAGVLAGLGTLVATQVVSGIPQLSRQVNEGIGQVEDWLSGSDLALSSGQLASVTDQLREQVQANAATIASSLASIATAATSLVTGAFIVLFLVIFFLYDGARLWRWCVHLLPRAAVAPVDGAVHRGWLTLVHYVRATVLVAFTDSVGVGIGMLVLGVPLAVPLAAVVFVGAFVPIVGALVSGTVAVLVAVVTVGPTKALVLFGIVLVVQQLEGHVLQPFLLGRAVSVHPVAVILAIAGGIALAGIPGALFAVPIVAVTNTVIGYLVRGGDGGPEVGDATANAGTAPLEADVAPDPDGSPEPDGTPDQVVTAEPGSPALREGDVGAGTG